MKLLDYDGLAHLVAQLKANIKLVEESNVYTTSVAETVSYTVPNYTPGVDTLGVYVNGMKLNAGEYTVSDTTVTITNELDANQVCEFLVTRVEI